MLNKGKSITLTGQSKVTYNGTETIAMQFNGNIPENGRSSITTTIVNQEAYDANKEACRADADEFTKAVREIEDEEA